MKLFALKSPPRWTVWVLLLSLSFQLPASTSYLRNAIGHGEDRAATWGSSASFDGVKNTIYSAREVKTEPPTAEVNVRSLPDIGLSTIRSGHSFLTLPAWDRSDETEAAVAAPAIDPGIQTGDSHTAKTIQSFGGHRFDLILNPVVPPDPQVASGRTHVVQLVNSFGGIWTKQGTSVKTFYLYAFFSVSIFDSISDPKLLFDGQSQRWFASEMDISTNSIRLAVSKSEDPTKDWWIYNISASPNLPDQPILGVSDDKIVLSSNDFSGSGCASHGSPCSWAGVQYWVLNKAGLTSGSAIYSSFGPYSQLFSVHPVRSLSATSTQFMVSNRYGILQVFSIVGVPPGPVTTSEFDLVPSPILYPPNAVQKGSSLLLDTGDNRVQDSVWFEGKLWLALSDGCFPSGDTQKRSCARISQIDTINYTLLQDFDVGISGKYLFYPALSTDGLGNLLMVLGYSSSTDYPGLVVSEQLFGDPPNSVRPLRVLPTGSRAEGVDELLCSSICRYGDYFGIGPDPSDPSLVWVTGEFGMYGGWGTYIAGISAYRPSGPIAIQGNSGFTRCRCIASGNGNSTNPYLIEGWYVNASSSSGIEIQNTTSFFVIMNVFVVLSSINSFSGIELVNTTNGRVVNSLVVGALIPPTHFTSGIVIWDSRNVSIFGNRLSNSVDGIVVETSTNVTISNNNTSRNYGTGISVTFSSNNTFIFGNTVSENQGWGIFVSLSSSIKVHHNSFINNSVQAYDDRKNLWDNGYPSGGNYWSDYAGVDNCSGPLQNVCTGGDGLGDIPYNLVAGNVDHYPLMVPRIDVAVTKFALSRNFAYAGVRAIPIVANVTVANYGVIDETLSVRILLDGGPTVPDQIVALPSGKSVMVTFYWNNIDFFDRGNWTLSAQVSSVPGEANLDDNTLTESFEIRLQGDVVSDCKVNIFDIATMAFSYNSSLGTDKWNPYADLDNDGRVSILDVAAAAINYDAGC